MSKVLLQLGPFSLEKIHLRWPDARVNGNEDEDGRQNVGDDTDSEGTVCWDECCPSTSEVDGSQEESQ